MKDRTSIYKLITNAIQKGTSVEDMCMAVKISYPCFYRWRREDPIFNKAVEEAQDYVIGIVEDKLYQNATKGTKNQPHGNPGAQMFYLTRRAPKRWKPDTNKIDASSHLHLTVDSKEKKLENIKAADEVLKKLEARGKVLKTN